MATIDVLHDGYARSGDGVAHVGSTCTLVRSGDAVVVIDPGMVTDRSLLLAPLTVHGVAPADVTDVVLSHHHPDHTLNVGLFPNAWVHDHWARYRGDVWDARDAEGIQLADDVELWATPGHTPQDISTVIRTAHGVVVATHLWWHATMDGDPRATDLDAMHANRARVLEVADRIIPGHGPAFDVSDATPR